MDCSIDGVCARRSKTDNAEVTQENYLLTGVAILILVTFAVINCTVRSSTAVVMTLCAAVSLFMIWVCMTAVASQGSMLRPIGSTAAGSQLPIMANTMDTRVLVGSNPSVAQFKVAPKTTAQNCLVGAFNPDFIDLNEVAWNYKKIPVDGAVPGAGDPFGQESARWMAASQAWRDKIAQGIRPDDNVVWDEDEDLPWPARTNKPVEVYDFSPTAHGGYGQRMIQEGASGTASVPSMLEPSFGPHDCDAPRGVIQIDDHYSHRHGPEGTFVRGFD